MSKIVLAGQDVRLLETRAEVLRKTGVEVVSCVGPEAINVVAREVPELLVLCHSIPHDEAELIVDKVRACCPKTKVLLVVSQVIGDSPRRDAKFDAISFPEPTKLVTRVTQLLRDLPLPGANEVIHKLESTAI